LAALQALRLAIAQVDVKTSAAPTLRASRQTILFIRTSFGNNRGFNQGQNRLFQIDREIDRLCYEIDNLKAQRRRGRGKSSGLKSRIKQLEYRVDDLERERKQIRKFGINSRNSFRSY